MNEAKNRIESDFAPTFPDDNIKCKDCVHRKADLTVDGKTVVQGYKNAYCKIYTKTIAAKPNKILFENANCKYYTKDDS